MGIETAILGAGALGLGGAIMGSNAQKSAANTSADAQRESIAAQTAQYNQTRKDNLPYMQAGYKALDQLQNFNPHDSVSAEYQMQQGAKGMNRQLAARGMLGGGNAATRLAELNQGIRANDYNTQYNKLTDMLKVGQGAAGSINSAGQNAANQNSASFGNIGNAATQAGNATASLYSGLGGAERHCSSS